MNDGVVTRFPYSPDRTKRLNLIKRIVPCQVSGRWLQFPEALHCQPDGTYMLINVMTDNGEGKERKLCELVLYKEDLEAILKYYVKT
ncbi:MAG: hypothetical protein B0W54_02475 [Cellvibrio sp. 79]|nr:MAG: hypothetical protein B0W54_02475 [Cellvibrio sp. 79]